MATESHFKTLIVEDDLHIADIARLILVAHGHEVKAANVAEYALELLEDEEFDLIVLDIMLPEMDGYEFLIQMSRRQLGLPEKVVIMSALQEREDIERAKQAGVNTYITKPFTAVQFISIIDEHIAAMPGRA